MLSHIGQRIQGLLLNILFALVLMQITGLKAVEEKNINSASKADYDDDYTDEDDTSNIIKMPKSTTFAYFENNVTTIYASDNEKIILTCTPKNFDESQHIILWYNNDILITNGNNTLKKGYEIDNKFHLTILHYDKEMPSNYSCLVMPGEIRQYVLIKPQHEAPDNMIAKGTAAVTTDIKGIKYLSIIYLSIIVGAIMLKQF